MDEYIYDATFKKDRLSDTKLLDLIEPGLLVEYIGRSGACMSGIVSHVSGKTIFYEAMVSAEYGTLRAAGKVGIGSIMSVIKQQDSVETLEDLPQRRMWEDLT